MKLVKYVKYFILVNCKVITMTGHIWVNQIELIFYLPFATVYWHREIPTQQVSAKY